jgi:TetR/AcrR family transcriptional regulator
MERDTRERILAAAEEVFAEKGYAGARIRDVASRVGVANALVHYHFHTKEDLLHAVLDRMVGEVGNLVLRIAPEPLEPVEKLCRFFYEFFDFAARHPHFARLAHLEAGHDDHAFFDDQVRERLRPLYGRARAFLESGVQAGAFRSVPPDHLLAAIYGMIVSWFSDTPFLETLLGDAFRDGGELELRREVLMDMILRIVLADPAAVHRCRPG